MTKISIENGNVIIPEGITEIDKTTLTNEIKKEMKSVTIPSTVIKIGDKAFYRCSKLEYIEIPDTINSIGYRAFSHCEGLTSITIPNSVTTIVT